MLSLSVMYRYSMYGMYCLFFVLSLFILVKPSWAEKRVAVVIGNGHYQHLAQGGRSVIPMNDTDLITTHFRQFGFEVMAKQDVTFKQWQKMLADLKKTVKEGDELILFYIGHTVSMDHETYIPGTDTDFSNKSAVKKRSLKLTKLVELLAALDTKSNVLFFIPFEPYSNIPALKTFRTDLFVPTYLPNTLVVYATQQDTDIATNAGQVYSLYTKTFIELCQQRPYTEIQELLKATKNTVKKQSAQTQIPSVYGKLEHDFYIIPFEKNFEGTMRQLWAWSQKHWIFASIGTLYLLSKIYAMWHRFRSTQKKIYAKESRIFPQKLTHFSRFKNWFQRRFLKR